ncbi:MAG: hypothetical protein R3C10_14670 [Pirellulales bacterium]
MSRTEWSDDGNLVIFFAPRYNLAKSYCERAEPTSQLTSVVSAIVGRPLRVTVAIDPTADEADEVIDETAAGAAQRVDVRQHPLVMKAAELFEARPVRVEEAE